MEGDLRKSQRACQQLDMQKVRPVGFSGGLEGRHRGQRYKLQCSGSVLGSSPKLWSNQLKVLMFSNTSVLLKYFEACVCTIMTVEGAHQAHGNLREDLCFCFCILVVTSELFAYLPVVSIRPSSIMVLFASGERATSSHSD